MTFINTIAPEAADDTVAAMYERQQANWGYIPNYAKAFSHRPEVLARWGRLLAEIKRPMDKRRFELVTFVVAHELKNSACAIAHGKALREFFGDQHIVAIAAQRCADGLSDADLAMLRFARQIARDASKITAHQVGELKGLGFTDEEVFDIAATAAGRAFFTKLLDALGVELDSAFSSVDAALRLPLIVGRPIDPLPGVTMPARQSL